AEGEEARDQVAATVPAHEDHHLGGRGPGSSPPAGPRRGLPAAGPWRSDDVLLGGGGRRTGDGAPGAPGTAELYGDVRGWPQPSIHPAEPGRGSGSGPPRGGAPYEGSPGACTRWSSLRRHLGL